MQYSKRVKLGTGDSEVTYIINAYKATTGLSILASLTKLLGLPLAHLFVNGKKDVDKVLPVAIEALAARMDEDDVVALVKKMLGTTTVDSETLDQKFDTHFQGRIGHLFQLLVEVVKYQFADFLSVAVSAGLREMGNPQSKPPSTSNG